MQKQEIGGQELFQVEDILVSKQLATMPQSMKERLANLVVNFGLFWIE